jgi:ketosteroid isomerase-like protein
MSRPGLTAHFLLVLLTCLALGAPVSVSRAAGIRRPHKELKQQIEELEQQWRTATLTADVGAMDRLLSDDYVGISWNGQVNTKAMQIDRIRNRTFSLTKLDLYDLKVKLVGDVAIVTGRAEVEGVNDSTQMKGTFRYTRVYQRIAPAPWKITNFEATRVPDPASSPHHAHNASS